MHGWMHKCINASVWMDRWMDGWLDSCIEQNTSWNTGIIANRQLKQPKFQFFFFIFFFGWAFLFLSNIFISYNQIMKKRIFFFYCRNSLESKQEGRKGCLQICFSDLSMNKKLSLVFRFFPLPSAFVSIFLNFCGRIFLFFFFWIS